jgi:spore coat polysaccharide biosynthesis protein SpsF
VRVVAVIQARTGSTRLPGKVLEPIAGRPLVLWTLAAIQAVQAVDDVVVATTTQSLDDSLAALIAEQGVHVHRGPTTDVLTRCWEAVAPFEPALVVRETADNPFVDPGVVDRQIARAIEDDLDYVGISGWPLGIAAEVARAGALEIAYRESVDSADREHVMPYLYNHPERFSLGTVSPAEPIPPGRFTVDTEQDLAFARAVAQRLGSFRPTSIGELAGIVAAEPALLELNREVVQRSWQEVGP